MWIFYQGISNSMSVVYIHDSINKIKKHFLYTTLRDERKHTKDCQTSTKNNLMLPDDAILGVVR